MQQVEPISQSSVLGFVLAVSIHFFHYQTQHCASKGPWSEIILNYLNKKTNGGEYYSHVCSEVKEEKGSHGPHQRGFEAGKRKAFHGIRVSHVQKFTLTHAKVPGVTAPLI